MGSPVSVKVSPQMVAELMWSFARTRAVVTALDLNLFTELDQGRHTVRELAQAAHAGQPAVRMLLNALSAMQLLVNDGDGYRLTDEAQALLSRKSPRSLASVAQQALNVSAADTVGRHLLEDWPQGQPVRVLNLGAGADVWGLAFARLNPQARVTVAGTPESMEEIAQTVAAREHVAEPVECLTDRLADADFGARCFEIVTLGPVSKEEGASDMRQLLAKVRRALVPDGHLVLTGGLLDEAGSQAHLPPLFALNTLDFSAESKAFTNQFWPWLQEAGFDRVITVQMQSPSSVIVSSERTGTEKAA
jgi:hypothetical protein